MTTTSDPASVEMPGADTPSTEIVARTTSISEHAVSVMPLLDDEGIKKTWRIASALAKSGMFKDVVHAERAFAKILIGRDLGISPTQALMSIDIVKGNVQLRGVLLAAFVRKSANYHYKIVESTHTKARVLMLGFPQDEPEDGFVRSAGRWWEVLGESEFTVEDAERANLVKNDSAWQTHPKNMCIWRAISNGVKFHCPDLFGGMPVYVEGELDTRSSSYAQVPDHGKPKADPDLPAVLAGLVAQAHAIDPNAWRVAEVAARLPDPGDDGYAAAVEAIRNEVASWLAEHDPPEAEVVDAKATDAEDPQARWDTDPEWRAQVEPLVNAYADISAGLDDAVNENDEPTAAKLAAELAGVEDALDALGCPAGWVPSAETQA